MKKYIKLLVENLFDDDLFDIDNTAEDLLDQSMKEFDTIVKDTLCQNSQYHSIMPEDKDDGLPAVIYDPDNTDLLYAGLTATYKSLGLGPRKRKKYSLSYFYKYTIKFNDDGTISLYIKYYNSNNFCILNSQLINFIEQSSYKIDTIYFMDGRTTNLTQEFKCMYIIGDNNKLSDKFIYNFPKDIQPHANEEVQEVLQKKTSLYKTSFSSDEKFFELMKKIVNLGYEVKDKEGNTYNKNNIDEKAEEVLSGERDRKVQKEEQQRFDFITNILGQDYVAKFEKILNYYKSINKNFYLKTINTLRNENKINLINTVYNLKKDNNLINLLDKDDEDYDTSYDYENAINNDIDYKLLKIILYKMYFILDRENLKSFRDETTLYDCKFGFDYEYSYYGGSTTKYLDINDLPIKLTSITDLWKYYYVIAKALIQCKDLKDKNILNWDMSETEVQKLNLNMNVNLSTFNFDYLTKQLKTIIDKTYKKLKLHKN